MKAEHSERQEAPGPGQSPRAPQKPKPKSPRLISRGIPRSGVACPLATLFMAFQSIKSSTVAT